MKTFAERFCAQHRVQPEAFDRVVLRRCLYPHARLVRPFLVAAYPDHFEADLDLVRSVGRIVRLTDFALETAEYRYHPANTGTLHRFFKLRISVRRLRHLVAKTFAMTAEAAG